ncbi:uncharacterized protein L201_000005 [Kwoniella dendrophila CBS 6074]|uniref:Zn(2)-C6 fungal-type domain-containing protein n=1 Tax=Kwoniella dendrophila CBS 6074 TaxID=1295534 RepID=A0AAX4JJT0_9TREE
MSTIASSSRQSEAGPSTTRTRRACSSCSQQKLKCDGGKPCSRCRMRGKRKAPSSPVTTPMTVYEEEMRESMRKGDSFGMLPPENPTVEYIRWKRNTSIGDTVPRNSSIWQQLNLNQLGQPQELYSKRPRIDQHTRPNENPAKSKRSLHKQQPDRQLPDDVADKLTSLPLPGDRNPLAVLAEASATVSAEDESTDASPLVDTALKDRKGYYAPLRRTLKDEAPHIMAFIDVSEAEKLFDLYFSYLHPHLPLLDPSHSSPSAVARRNNFLFNAICCASAKARDPALWERLSDFARFEMERIPKEKNIDVIQGHLIYITWNLHRPRHFEMDLTWLRVGMAMRTAVDINLHRIASSQQARDGLPRWVLRAIARTWLGVYITDRTISAQLGKPATSYDEHSIKSYIQLLRQDSTEKSTSTPEIGHVSSPEDLWIAALAEWTQILVKSIETPLDKGDSEDSSEGRITDIRSTHQQSFIQQFRVWRDSTEQSIRKHHMTVANASTTSYQADTAKETALSLRFIMSKIRLYQQYAELVVHSSALDKLTDSIRGGLAVTLIELRSAATRLIGTYHSSFDAHPDFHLGCPDMLHTFVTYAAVSLLRILHVQLVDFEPDPEEIIGLAQRAADMLDRAESTNELPSELSLFLTNLIEAKKSHLDYRKGQKAAQEDLNNNTYTVLNHLLDAELAVHGHAESIAKQIIDLEAFGEILDQDQGQSIWPPMPVTPQDQFDAYLETLFPSFGLQLGNIQQQQNSDPHGEHVSSHITLAINNVS